MTRNDCFFKLLITSVILTIGCSSAQARETLSLAGEWKCALDPDAVGETQQWMVQFPAEQSKPAILPGSLDTNGIGYPAEKTHLHLGKPLDYVGIAWYQKSIEIPASFDGQNVELFLERTKVSQVWINGILVGAGKWVYAPQHFDVSDVLIPGARNTITISIDNTMALVPVEGSHAYSYDTQTNWNGIIGEISFRAKQPNYLKTVKIRPDVDQRQFLVHAEIQLLSVDSPDGFQLRARAKLDGESSVWMEFETTAVDAGSNTAEVFLTLGKKAKLWSDIDPNLYQIEVELGSIDASGAFLVQDEETVLAGLREFRSTPDGFTINGNRVFLRGKHDACVFPITGYPATSVDEWMREFGIAKTYGINHYRFHSFTPPAAAYEAADRMGVYLQSELPMWWGFDAEDESEINYLVGMGKAITDSYANHASFVMFALGNELYQERSVLKRMVSEIRSHDDRPLYAQGSNNRLWDPSYAEGDDYWRSFRTGPFQDDGSTAARLSMSYLDSNGEGGMLNSRYPSTMINFDRAMERSPVPFVGFEVGQYQVFPNFSEIPKYTGVLKPYNLEIYRQRLDEAGMLDQAQSFFRASGALSVICYRADIEAMLRTKGYAGFDLLDLQDYPGQGTALVGMLDAFMDSKGLITPDEWRQFCDDTVLLLEQEKYCWTDAEVYQAKLKISNFSNNDYSNGMIEWQLRDGRHVLKKGSLSLDSVAFSGLTKLSESISIPLKDVVAAAPVRLDLDLYLKGTEISNHYPIWVYPASQDIETPASVMVVDALNDSTFKALRKGARVVLFPTMEAIHDYSTKNQFISEFWNWEMFTGFAKKDNKSEQFISAGTNGILLDPRHELFSGFPTEFHTNYQWWPIVTHSRALILDELEQYRPTVQVIDSISRLHKLGMVCEFKVGDGKLLVCSSRLPDHLQYPEVRQFYRSLLKYVDSNDFDPQYEITAKQLSSLGLWMKQ